MTAIDAQGLGKVYANGVTALSDLSLTVSTGEVFGFLGPNGAGKTTTVRLLNGMLTPTSGRAVILGSSSDDQELRKRTATLAELARMYEHLTVRENLRFFAALYDIPRDEATRRIEELLERMALSSRADDRLGTFSTGMKKRVYLARTLLHRPEIIFLDEPTAGLDPDAAEQVTALIHRLARESGATVFLCTHHLTFAARVCDSFGFIKDGRLVASGSHEELIRSVEREQKVLITTQEARHEVSYRNETEIDDGVRRIMASGEHIVEVVKERATLEDAYFHYIGRSGHELG